MFLLFFILVNKELIEVYVPSFWKLQLLHLWNKFPKMSPVFLTYFETQKLFREDILERKQP